MLAAGIDYIGPTPSTLFFTNEQLATREIVCTSIDIVPDNDDFESAELISIEITNPSSPNIGIDTSQSVFTITIRCTDDVTRLALGVDVNQGLVQYCFDGFWYNLCAADIDVNAADVVCREIRGFSDGEFIETKQNYQKLMNQIFPQKQSILS